MRGREIAIAVATMAAVACSPHQREHEGSVDAAGGGGGGGNDAAGGSGSGSDTDSQTFVYAHTASTLFQVNPDMYTVTEVGDFQWSAGADQMTDIAIDKTGTIIGVSFTAVYQVNPATAVATQLSASLNGMFNGLSFVPAAAIGQTGDDVLVGTRASDGMVFRIDPTTGATTAIGNMGASYESSGDLVAVAGFGTVQTVPGTGGGDVLVTLAADTFAASPAPSPTGFTDIWGVAFWKGQVFGFTDTGQFLTIDPQTGVGTLISTSGNAWWGAAVTTTAPVID
jgi:hypothetical protein